MSFYVKFLVLLSYFCDDMKVFSEAKKVSKQKPYDVEIDEGFRYVGIITSPMSPSPEIHVQMIDMYTVRTKIAGRTLWFKVRDRVRWPARMKVGKDGSVDIRFLKRRYREKEETYNSSVQMFEIVQDKLSDSFPEHWYIDVVDKDELTHDTCLLTVRYVNDMFNYIGPGQHITVKQKVGGRIREYQYTPVPYFPIERISDPNPQPGDWMYLNQNLYLYVKSYTNGTLSKWLCEKKPGEAILITNPQGSFRPDRELKGMKRIFLIAAGTGITPMLSLMLWALKMIQDVKVTLYFFNKTEKDIAWKNEFKAIEKIDERFSVEYILSQPKKPEEWKGRIGRISLEMIKEMFPKNRGPNTKSKNYFAVCGLPLFTANTVRWLTTDMGYKTENVYAFLGQ